MSGDRPGAPDEGGLVVACPVCRRPVRWEDPPRGPFCSERCRLVDLGAWAEGRYAVPGPPVPDEERPAGRGEPDEPGKGRR